VLAILRSGGVLVPVNLGLKETEFKYILEDSQASFLITCDENAKVDLKSLGRQLGAGNLSFASEERLEKYLEMPQVQKMLQEAGYGSGRLEDILPVFCERYETYAERGKSFPHELGLLLGYPPEDVEGFIRHQGRNSLCTGYWKVYADKEGKQRLFEKYEYARENLIQLLHYGLKMTEIIDICGCTAA